MTRSARIASFRKPGFVATLVLMTALELVMASPARASAVPGLGGIKPLDSDELASYHAEGLYGGVKIAFGVDIVGEAIDRATGQIQSSWHYTLANSNAQAPIQVTPNVTVTTTTAAEAKAVAQQSGSQTLSVNISGSNPTPSSSGAGAGVVQNATPEFYLPLDSATQLKLSQSASTVGAVDAVVSNLALLITNSKDNVDIKNTQYINLVVSGLPVAINNSAVAGIAALQSQVKAASVFGLR